MSEFSTLTTRLITPLLRLNGFKKHGTFNRSSTFDFALYKRGNVGMELTLAFHPYDYPDLGIRMQVHDDSGILFDRLHPPTEGGIEAMLRSAISDIESAVSEVRPRIVRGEGSALRETKS